MANFMPMAGRRRGALAARLVATGAIALGTLWVVGFLRFVAMIPDSVVDQDTPTDAIAVLTGAPGRMSTGLELLARGQAKKLFVSGVYRGVDVYTLLEVSKRRPDDLACCIEIGHAADNTLGNAAETAAWMSRQGYTSLRIVTSNWHMPRSLLEFREAMPDVRLIPNPVFHPEVKMERWWAWPGTAGLIFREYNKFIAAWLNHLADGLFPDQTLS
jgi:uncharacterized SAM-binding protein YcdF (DUF218 family)